MIMLCLSPALSDLSTLTLTHTSVPISQQIMYLEVVLEVIIAMTSMQKATFTSFFLLFDFIRKFCSFLDLERGKSS